MTPCARMVLLVALSLVPLAAGAQRLQPSRFEAARAASVQGWPQGPRVRQPLTCAEAFGPAVMTGAIAFAATYLLGGLFMVMRAAIEIDGGPPSDGNGLRTAAIVVGAVLAGAVMWSACHESAPGT